MNIISSFLPSARPPFLILAVVCVCLGTSVAIYRNVSIDYLYFTLAIIGGITAAMSVNLLNEYSDFKSGLDAKTNRTPFSGGSGWLIKHPHFERSVLNAAFICLVITFFIGIYFAVIFGPIVIYGGLLGLLIIATYTNILNKSAWLCLISPGVGFGILMTLGSQLVQSGKIYEQAIWIAVIPTLLINNLLLLNQYPDIKADKQAGRNHMPIRYGINFSNLVLGIQLMLATAELAFLIATQGLPPMSAWAFIPLLTGAIAFYGMVRHQEAVAKKTTYLALNTICANVTPLVLAIVLWIS